jgi:hypothetical protein
MVRTSKRRSPATTPTPPSYRKHHFAQGYKRQRRGAIPPPPDFSSENSDDDCARTTRASTKYRVVVSSDSSEDDSRADSNHSMSFHPYRKPLNAPPTQYRVVLGDSSDDSEDDQVHACMRPAESRFRPCCLPLSAVWSGSTLRMKECFRENLLGGGPPKSQTLRPEWCISTLKQHTKLLEKGMWFRVNCGGQGNVRTVGWAQYLSMDLVQLQDLTPEDCVREGRPGMPVHIFLKEFLLRAAITHKEAYTRRSGKHVPARLAKPALTPLSSAPRFTYQFLPCTTTGQRSRGAATCL